MKKVAKVVFQMKVFISEKQKCLVIRIKRTTIKANRGTKCKKKDKEL